MYMSRTSWAHTRIREYKNAISSKHVRERIYGVTNTGSVDVGDNIPPYCQRMLDKFSSNPLQMGLYTSPVVFKYNQRFMNYSVASVWSDSVIVFEIILTPQVSISLCHSRHCIRERI